MGPTAPRGAGPRADRRAHRAAAMRPTRRSTRCSRSACWFRRRRRRARGDRDLPRAAACRCLPRGAGSSQCGQTVGAALVIDHSKHLNRVVAFDADAQTVTVEPGIVLDALNAWLRPARPVVSGRRQHVGAMHAGRHGGQQLVRLALDRVRQHGAQRARDRCAARRRHRSAVRPRARDGTRLRRACASCSQRCAAIGVRERDEIERGVPKVMRRVGGYNIDVFHPAERAPVHALTAASTSRICWSAAKARSRGRAR